MTEEQDALRNSLGPLRVEQGTLPIAVHDLTIPAKFQVALLQDSKFWLSAINQFASQQKGWNAHSVLAVEDLIKESSESEHLFSIVEINRENVEERLGLVQKIVQIVGAKGGSIQSLAIVGNLDFSHHELDQQDRLPRRELVRLERIFRAAGVVHCCWNSENVERLVRIVNRFAQSLPPQRVSIQEYIWTKLPWSNSGIKANMPAPKKA